MQIRATIQLDNEVKKLVLVSQENETPENMALKLAAYVLFFRQNPIAGPGSKHHAILGQEFLPDLICLNEYGELSCWIECGNVTTHKLDKLLRRNRNARVVVMKATPREGDNLRQALAKNDVASPERLEIFAFPEGEFKPWLNAMEESVEIVGEASDRSFNLVANSSCFNFDFLRK